MAMYSKVFRRNPRSVSIKFSDSEEPGRDDLAKGCGGKYIYLDFKYNDGSGGSEIRIKYIALYQSRHDNQAQSKMRLREHGGWTVVGGGDIN